MSTDIKATLVVGGATIGDQNFKVDVNLTGYGLNKISEPQATRVLANSLERLEGVLREEFYRELGAARSELAEETAS